MNKTKTGAPESAPANSETRDKDTKLFQFQQTQIAFFAQPQTMMQIARQVGIDRANVCWYVRELRKVGAIWLIRKGTCPITGHNKVQYLTTNPQFVENKPKQLTLF